MQIHQPFQHSTFDAAHHAAVSQSRPNVKTRGPKHLDAGGYVRLPKTLRARRLCQRLNHHGRRMKTRRWLLDDTVDDTTLSRAGVTQCSYCAARRLPHPPRADESCRRNSHYHKVRKSTTQFTRDTQVTHPITIHTRKENLV